MKYSQPRNSLARFVPILLVIIITVVAVAAVIAIGRSLFGGNTPSPNPAQTIDEGKAALLSSDASHSVKLTVRGPIVANEKFRSYTILVSPTARTQY